MAKQVQAYFATENQAEGSKTTLLTYKTEHLEVSKLVKSVGRSSNVLIPLVAANPAGNMSTGGAGGAVGIPGILAGGDVVPMVKRNDTDTKPNSPDEENPNNQGSLLNGDTATDHYEGLEYVLVAKVEDHHYDEIVQKLRQNGAYVEIFD